MTDTTASEAVPELTDFDPYTEEFRQDPYPEYQRVLALGGPVYWEYMDCYLVARHADSLPVLTDTRFKVEPPEEIAALMESIVPESLMPMQRTMLFRDPPEHTRLRTLARDAFTPQALGTAVETGRGIAREILAGLRPGQEFDAVRDLAYPVALRVIGDVLGVPPEDLERLRPHAAALVPAADIPARPGSVEAAIDAYQVFDTYFAELAKLRAEQGGEHGLYTSLMAAEAEGVLTEAELHAMAALVFISGHDTLVGFIANALQLFTTHPEQLALLRERPDLAGQATDEILRYESPLQLATAGGGRWATEDVEIAGRVIPAGSKVLTLIAAANRDPAVYPDPDRFDITRSGSRHLALGHGLHYCLGNALVKAEGRMMMEELAAHSLQFALVNERPQWLPVLIQRRLGRLDLRVTHN